MSSYLAKLAGQAINLTGVVAPRVAGRMAFGLFSVARPPVPASAKARKLLRSSETRMGQAQKLMLGVPHGHVASHHFPPIGTPRGKRYLIVHGWGSRIDYMQALVTGLRETGAEIVGLDLPGHGGSSGRTMTVPMAIDAIDAAWRQYGGFDAIIGHSFGGFVAAMVAGGPADWVRRHTPAKLVLIAAPVAARHVFDGYAGMMGFSGRVRRALDDQARATIGKPVEFFAADTMLADIPETPVLVLHAEDDKEVGAGAARRYGRAGGHVRVHWANGLGHRRIVNSPEVIDAIKTFLG
ncbi:alpha/beta fold hydrolase [Rhizobium sp. KVB221]|uniref:Alpha/beta fold hydrolase n=1 Tax=Rhizobium setariae TaxID=2801340 RepID=A0A936YMF4_9HYPH|nr:alpha/beta fold hydrolase [Rhizobium setariae]MBL0373093.1 alpha/beta fold hydrolase [Rhizobium setariae]